MRIFIIIFLLTGYISIAQENKLAAFDHLINKTWKADGKWGNGSEFKQEIHFKYSLNKSIVVAESIGFIDKEQTKLGLRNHGIRQYDSVSGKIRFWEFDVFGGLTEGKVIVKDNNLYYQYKYGDSIITDGWEKIDETTYNFKVGEYTDGQWQQLYLETKFIQVE
ncbi:hypothetical protein GTQ40_07550 [Flavobacteriaceae bacterium R38]|nr:hypothetical protein [Flavobacteriaceae bacterium R38]